MIVQYIQEAVVDGARVKKACQCIKISYKSFLRWRGGYILDNRKGAQKNIPRKLSEDEKNSFYSVANEKRFRDLTPPQIVATLLEEEIYYASASTLYRIFKEKKANIYRSETRVPRKHTVPPELTATGPNQVWTWDITWLKTDIKGIYLYAYVIIDIFSRKIISWVIKEYEDMEYARDLFDYAIKKEKVRPRFVHADNGGPMRGVSLVAFLTSLNVELSYNRPRTSNDNPYSESWFGTLKRHVSFPNLFKSTSESSQWFANFVDAYNTKHQHSGIGYVTPEQKHTGQDVVILKRRQNTLNEAAALHPERFVNGPRKITPVTEVCLNHRRKDAA